MDIILTSSDRIKLQNPLPLQLTLESRVYGRVNRQTGRQYEKPVNLSCRLLTEIGIGSDAIRFSFQVNKFVRADSGCKNADGKYAKVLTETWEPAKVYHFSPKFELSVDNYTESLFPNSGYIVGHESISNRVELADLFERLITNGDIDFIKTIEIQHKTVLLSAYDASILLLLELKNRTKLDDKSLVEMTDKGLKLTKQKYSPIPLAAILDSFVDAYDTAKDVYKVPIVDGMLLKTLNDFAKQRLAILKPAKSEEHKAT